MALTRRQFIKRTGLAAAGSFLGSGLFRNPLLERALAATIGDRYFVVVFLDGGNDGLNTVTPVDNGLGTLRTDYQTARRTGPGGLQLPTSGSGAVLIPARPFRDPNTQAQLGFHPGLQGFRNLYDLGKLAVIQGCGYPDYSLSHAESRSAWQTGNPLGSASAPGGWMGRYLAASYAGTDIPSVNIADDIAGEFVQTTTSVLAMRRVARFRFPYDSYDASDSAAKKTAYLSLCSQASGSAQPTLRYVGDTGTATEIATESYPPLSALYQGRQGGYWDNQYGSVLATGFARDLREVAKVIYGVSTSQVNINARFFEVRNGGYDTHSDQGAGNPGDQQYDLHSEVADALELFYHDCVDMGVADKVCILVWSEFGRRVQQNDNGTDHGSQAPMFVIGGSVNGGVYGNHPNINGAALNGDGNTPYSQAAADPTRSTDIRDVYGTILNKWLGMTSPLQVLPQDVGDPTRYWTAPNFALGFLT
jgi:uncharacterized protein (DUF1501 family)